MKAASILIKPCSSNCNLDCRYCFYKVLSSNREQYSKGFMSDEILEKLIIRGIEYTQQYVSFAFQGGEPTLAGVEFFEKAVALQKKYNTKHLVIENTIQTNGMLIDDRWAKFLAENHFLVGLSLDGPRKMHDLYRRDIHGKDTFTKVMHTISLFEKYGVNYNILTVVTNDTAMKASYLYNFYKRNHFPFVQLIPCMDENSRDKEKTQSSYAVEPQQYGEFLCKIFDLWYEDFQKGEQMDIRMFSNLAQMAAGYPPEECGMNGCCNCYFVVEGDGSVYPCDFYCLDEWKLGTVQDSFQTLIQSDKAKHFIASSKCENETCKKCPYLKLCHGGCRRWREPVTENCDSANLLCEAYEIFFEHTWERIEKLGKLILQRYGRPNK